MGLGEFVLLSESERDSGGAERASILADAFEAVVGAIYLDQGIKAARRFVEKHLLSTAKEILEDRAHLNFKSLLQEYVQAKHKTHPRYRVVTEAGPDHMKQFTVEVTVRGRLLGKGNGRNKKEAEQDAAGDALDRLRQLDTDDPILSRSPDPQPLPQGGAGGDAPAGENGQETPTPDSSA
jgi:ribonuclease-3